MAYWEKLFSCHKRTVPQLQALYAETFAANRLDAIVFPTTPLPAQPISGTDMNVMLNGKEAPTFPTFIRNTDPGSNAGIPGLTIPAGLTPEGLPVGLELDGPFSSDRRLLAIGLSVEKVLGPIGRPSKNNRARRRFPQSLCSMAERLRMVAPPYS